MKLLKVKYETTEFYTEPVFRVYKGLTPIRKLVHTELSAYSFLCRHRSRIFVSNIEADSKYYYVDCIKDKVTIKVEDLDEIYVIVGGESK